MSLGDLQYLTMLAVARLDSNAFAREIRDLLRDVGGRRVSVSTVFVTLARLEDQGLLTSHRGPTPPRGGRATRIFALTDVGWEAVHRTRAAAERMWEGLEMA
jgi:DNA-binding PadR family transcriptional regulator